MPSFPFQPDDYDQEQDPEENNEGQFLGDLAYINDFDWSANLNLFDPQIVNENTERLIAAFHYICDELGCTAYNPEHKTSLDLQYAARLTAKIRNTYHQNGLSFCYSRFNPEKGTCYLLLSFFDDRESSFFLPTSMMRDGHGDSNLWGQIRMLPCEAFYLNHELGGCALFLEFTLTNSSEYDQRDERPLKASSILYGSSKAIAIEHVKFAAERVKQRKLNEGYFIEPSILIAQALSKISEEKKELLEISDLSVLNSNEIISISVNSLPENDQQNKSNEGLIILPSDIIKIVYDFKVVEPLPGLVYPELVDRKER